MSRLQTALDQIIFARTYTTRLLDQVDERDWFRVPAAGVSHIAWQVGHLAVAQFRLGLERLRGDRDGDAALVAEEYVRLFGRTSVPDPDPAKYPAAAEIRAAFDRVHRRVLEEIPGVPDGELDVLIDPPHSIAKTKLQALHWCAHHELIHAGQVGLLRRQLGYPALW